MTATTETFVPPSDEAGGPPDRGRKWRRAFMIAGGVFVIGVLALRILPPLLDGGEPEPEVGPTLAPAVSVDQAPLPDARAEPPAVAPAAPLAESPPAMPEAAPVPASAAPAGDADNLEAAPVQAVGEVDAVDPDAGARPSAPATGANPSLPVPDLSDASGETELPVSEKVADRVMEAVGFGTPASAAPPAPAATVLRARVAVGGGQHLNVRSTPGVSGTATVIGSLADGSEIEISAWATAADGSVWVRLQDPEAPAIDQGWLFGPLVALADPEAAFTDLPEADL